MRVGGTVVGLCLLLGGCGAAQDTLGGGIDGALEDVRGQADELIARGQALGQAFDWCAGVADLSQAVLAGDVEGARAAAGDLRTTAPDDIGEDLRVIAEAAARAQVGDPRVLLDDEVRSATRDVHAYAVDLCGLPGGDA